MVTTLIWADVSDLVDAMAERTGRELVWKHKVDYGALQLSSSRTTSYVQGGHQPSPSPAPAALEFVKRMKSFKGLKGGNLPPPVPKQWCHSRKPIL